MRGKFRALLCRKRPDLVIPGTVWRKPWILHVTAWGNGEQAVAVAQVGDERPALGLHLEPEHQAFPPDQLEQLGIVADELFEAAAQAFVKFLYTPAAQKLFAQSGYRPVSTSVIKLFSFPVRPWLFTIGYVGGWDKVEKQFFDPNDGVMAKIERGLGH